MKYNKRFIREKSDLLKKNSEVEGETPTPPPLNAPLSVVSNCRKSGTDTDSSRSGRWMYVYRDHMRRPYTRIVYPIVRHILLVLAIYAVSRCIHKVRVGPVNTKEHFRVALAMCSTALQGFQNRRHFANWAISFVAAAGGQTTLWRLYISLFASKKCR